jgi:hypothetical protein
MLNILALRSGYVDDPDAKRALARLEGILTIPSWGKLWLALLGLYDWRGVPPLIPELWSVPEALPIHPSKFYCHTRHIQMAMSILYGRKAEAPKSALLDQIRDEVYTEDYAGVDWVSARRSLRRAELVTPPSRTLRAIYELLALFERHHSTARRARVLRDLDNRIRWELQTTDHTSISPVSGMLNILALRSGYVDDPDAKRALARLEATKMARASPERAVHRGIPRSRCRHSPRRARTPKSKPQSSGAPHSSTANRSEKPFRDTEKPTGWTQRAVGVSRASGMAGRSATARPKRWRRC